MQEIEKLLELAVIAVCELTAITLLLIGMIVKDAIDKNDPNDLPR